MRPAVGVLIGGLLALTGGTAAAQCPVIEDATVLTGGTVAGGRLGASLAVSQDGTRAAAGRPGDGASPITGAVLTYMYDHMSQDWQLDPGAAVVDPEGSLRDLFGSSVAIANGLMAVGAPGWDDASLADAGSVSIFRWEHDGSSGSWNFLTRITRPGGSQLDARFGWSLDLQHETGIGWTLIVGAPGVVGLFSEGEVSILTVADPGTPGSPNPWSDDTTLVGSSLPGAFGFSVAISGDSAIVGDPVASSDSGRVRVYQRDNGSWSSTPTTTAFGFNGDQLGFAVDIDGDVAVAGGPTAEGCCAGGGCSGAPPRGGVVVLERDGSGWIQGETGPGSIACGSADQFGRSVSVRDGLLAVGTPGAGSVALFVRSGAGDWEPVASVSESAAMGGFGEAVALAPGGRGLLLAWPGDSEVLAAAGTTLAWTPIDDCDVNGLPDDCEIARDPSLDCIGPNDVQVPAPDGILDACQLAMLSDCDVDGAPDLCEIAEAAIRELVDGDFDFVLDVCQLADGAPDCNANGVLDSIEPETIEIVWIVDTSVSQSERSARVCLVINGIEAALRALGLSIRGDRLSIVAGGDQGFEDCLTAGNSVAERLDTSLAGLGFPEDFGEPLTDERWAAASAIVALRYDWRTNLRVVIPLSDECAWDSGSPGDACSEDSQQAVDAAIPVLQCQDVMAFPIQFSGSLPFQTPTYPQNVGLQMERLAGNIREQPNPAMAIYGSGGQSFRDRMGQGDDLQPLIDAIVAELVASLAIHDNDGNGLLDSCELAPGDESVSLRDCNRNRIDDAFELLVGMSESSGGTVPVPVECLGNCPADVDSTGVVDFEDILVVLANYGCTAGPACAGDADGSGTVGFEDILAVISTWGPCRAPAACQTNVAGVLPPPQSIADCIQKHGHDAFELQKCIEAMLIAGTP